MSGSRYTNCKLPLVLSHKNIFMRMDIASLGMVRCQKLQTKLWTIVCISRRVDAILHTWHASILQYYCIPGSYTWAYFPQPHLTYWRPVLTAILGWLAQCRCLRQGPRLVLPPSKQSPLTFKLLIISMIISSSIGYHYHCSPSPTHILQHSCFHNFQFCCIKKDNFHMFCILVEY